MGIITQQSAYSPTAYFITDRQMHLQGVALGLRQFGISESQVSGLKRDVAFKGRPAVLRRTGRRRLVLRRLLSRYASRSGLYKNSIGAEGRSLKAHLASEAVLPRRPSIPLDRPVNSYQTFRRLRLHSTAGAKSLGHPRSINWKRYRKVSMLEKLGVLRSRIPLKNNKGRVIMRMGRPVTTWEIPNREMTAALRTIAGGVTGLGSFGSINYMPARRHSPSQNAYDRYIRKYVRESSNWRRPIIHTLETVMLGHKSKVACARSRELSRRVAWGVPSRVASTVTSKFRANTHSLTAMARLPKIRDGRIWVSPSYYGLRRLTCSIQRRSVRPLSSSVHQIVPASFIGCNLRSLKKSYTPRWRVEIGVGNFVDRMLVARGRTPGLNIVGGSGLLGAAALLRGTLIRARNPATAARISRLVPVIKHFQYRRGMGYLSTQSKDREFTNYISSSVISAFQRSLSWTRRRYRLGGLGVYARHPRWSSKTNKVFKAPTRDIASTLRSSYSRSLLNSKSWSQKTWLRNAGAIL